MIAATQAHTIWAEGAPVPFPDPTIDRCSQPLIRALVRRHRMVDWAPTLAGTAFFIAWMQVFGRGTDALEGTRWDLLDLCYRLGVPGILIIFVLGLGVGLTGAFTIAVVLRRRMLRRRIERHLRAPACFWCGHLLCGLGAGRSAVRCPECGSVSPIGESPGRQGGDEGPRW